MKKTILLLSTMFLATGVIMAQDQDPKAKVILDQVSEKSKTYTSTYASFTYNIKNESEGNIDITQKGKIWVKDKKYMLKLDDDITIINDGKAQYTIDCGEATGIINDLPDPDDFGIDPAKIFEIHDEKFKYRLDSDDGSVAKITLFPKNPKDVKFTQVVISVNKSSSTLKKVVVKGRDGTTYTYKIGTFTPNVTVSDKKLRCAKSEWPCVEEWIDLRE